MVKTAIYARHLTYRDYEPSVDEQIKICKDFAENKGLGIIKCYMDCFDEKQCEYPAFEKFASKCKEKMFDAVIMYSSFILGRNRQKAFNWINSLNKKGVQVYFVDIEKSEYAFLFKELERIKKQCRRRVRQ